MNIIYVSCLCSVEKYNDLFGKAKLKPGQQVQKYHRLLVEGLQMNLHSKVNVVSGLPITRANSKKLYLGFQKEKVGETAYHYLPIINIPFIKNILIMITSFFKVLSLGRKNKRSAIICDVLNTSVISGAILAGRILGINIVGIVTDIPAFLTDNPNSIGVKFSNYLIGKCTSYVVLTEAMNTLLNKKNKPYVVIEGQVDINMRDMQNKLEEKYSKKVCMYTGGLQKIYGIEMLVKGFLAANIEDSELHIYGDGDFKDELIKICNETTKVKYFGVVANEYIVKEQMKATLLINPRPTKEEYTKYSFPSKNMEYMVSGTPTLTTNLPGMPKEYKKYVYLLDKENAEGVEACLKEILNKTPEENHIQGAHAKTFVLEEKNNKIQAGKIIKMLERM